MIDHLKDWRVWFVVLLAAGYIAAAVAAIGDRTRYRDIDMDELDRILEHHIGRCELMQDKWNGYDCDT